MKFYVVTTPEHGRSQTIEGVHDALQYVRDCQQAGKSGYLYYVYRKHGYIVVSFGPIFERFGRELLEQYPPGRTVNEDSLRAYCTDIVPHLS